MKLEKLPLETAGLCGFTHKVKLTHEDLTQATANTAQTIALLSVGAGAYVCDCAMHLVTPFEDASDAAFNTTAVVIGDDGSTNRFLTSTELNKNGTEVIWKGTALTAPYVYTAANTIDIVFSSMAAKALADIDVGELDIFLNVVELSQV